MISRRRLLRWLSGLAITGVGFASYAFAIEPGFRLSTVTYTFTPPRWTPGLKLRVVVLSDPHLANPHMPAARWAKIIDTANAHKPDVMILLGDYLSGTPFQSGKLTFSDVVAEAKACSATLGTFAVCGNHDWWEDHDAQSGKIPVPDVVQQFESIGIPVLENRALRLSKDNTPFWLTGTSSIVAIRRGRSHFEGRDDLPGTLAQVTDDAPIIHLAHEPDLFVDVPERVSLTLSGHTHGGQVRLFGYSPITPSSYGNRFAYGHIVEDGRHLVVSGGLGCSVLPVRFGVPPEIVVLDLG